MDAGRPNRGSRRRGIATFLAIVCCSSLSFGHGSGVLPLDLQTQRENSRAESSASSFLELEIPQTHPIDLSADGRRLAVCNTADNRVELFNVDSVSGLLAHSASVPVGYSPISVRFRTNSELWVVNHVSDTISIVDCRVVGTVLTLDTADEPRDLVFVTDTSSGQTRAILSCSGSDVLRAYATDGVYESEIRLEGEGPRALASSGSRVFAAIFESGNSTTVLGGGLTSNEIITIPPNIVNDVSTPYGGLNPPPHLDVPGDGWRAGAVTVQRADLTTPPPPVALIVRRDESGAWRDDNGTDWSNWVDGSDAAMSGRFPGWELLDNDIAAASVSGGVVSVATTFGASGYATRLMNIAMSIAYNGANDTVVLTGTDATNEKRFEPNLTGRFLRVLVAVVDASTGVTIAVTDMNAEHLDIANGGTGDGAQAYAASSVNTTVREQSIGDPRAVVSSRDGSRLYVAGMGSNNVIVLDSGTGQRLGGVGHTIKVGVGPTGLACHATLDRLYVLNRFDPNVMVINTATVGGETVMQAMPFFDPTPAEVKRGRVALYGTHEGSGLGHIACASCHIDGRTDRLGWDLGNPAGTVKTITQIADPANPGIASQNIQFASGATSIQFHMMKGPMVTQTLQDIIGKEPLHWRGDRDGIEEFAGAFSGLQGADEPLDAQSMADFEAFLSTIYFPPNPLRALDNSLAGGPNYFGGTNPLLAMTGFVSTGRHSPLGTPLPGGSAWNGLRLFVDETRALFNRCVNCHALPIGSGSTDLIGDIPVAPGPLGESHLAITPIGVAQPNFKVAQLRNQMDKEGFYMNQGSMNADFAKSRAGFGNFHDGTFDGIIRFLSTPTFFTTSDQEVADLAAFVLSIRGGEFDRLLALPGAPVLPIPAAAEDHSAHAAVGKQVSVGETLVSGVERDLLEQLIELVNHGSIDLIAKGNPLGQPRGWVLIQRSGTQGAAVFQSDRAGETLTLDALLQSAEPANVITFTVVPFGLGERFGVDRDGDKSFDYTEILEGTDPTVPGGQGGGGGGCLIATAAYGTPLESRIEVLRGFRDRALLNNFGGAAIVDTYYRISPPAARLIAVHPVLATLVRMALWALLEIGHAYFCAVICALAIFGVVRPKHKRSAARSRR